MFQETRNVCQSWATRAVITCDVRTRKMCVCARTSRCGVCIHRRVQGSCHCLDAKLQKKRQLQPRLQLRYCTDVFLSVRRQTQLLQDNTWNQNSQVDFDNVELLAQAKLFPAAILNVISTLPFFTIGLTICRLATRTSAILKQENWNQNTPSNTPKTLGTKSKFGKETVHREALSKNVNLMGVVLACQDHMRRPHDRKSEAVPRAENVVTW